KLKQAVGFLEKKDKVKVNMFFRGREMAHREIGRNILDRMIKDVAEHGLPERSPSMEGRVMFILLNPVTGKV
ncbi:MAG: translation initiation factor IF-3 C-terminal domain-containing protein, partial [Candidatus Omnitrophica bacterium]|nr:translation initiation factor IF-3 C-terminal domain-containing protein [Candidatus Omnitrophota bacterium]